MPENGAQEAFVPHPLNHFRRTAAILLVWVAVLATVGVSNSGATQADDFELGKASAIAKGVRVDPRNGGLSFGITMPLALSDYTNQVARAEARSVDLGVIGVTLAATKCDEGDPTWPKEDQPQSIRTTSAEEGSAEGKQSTEYGIFDRSVRATDEPFSEATTIIAPFGAPGFLEIGPVTSHTATGVIDGAIREARAITEIGSIELGPVGRLDALRWELVHRTGAEESITAHFTIGSATIAGAPAGGLDADTTEQLDAFNDALQPLGLRLEGPSVRQAGDVTFLTPLRSSVVPAAERDDVLGGVVNELGETRNTITEALIAYDCGNGTYITIADLILGSVTGAGSLNLELGGVQASTGEIDGFTGLGDFVPFGPVGNVEVNPPVERPAAVTESTPPAPAPATPPAVIGGTEQALPVVDTAPVADERLLPIVALAGLATFLVMAEADRRKMKAALAAEVAHP